MTNKKYPNLPVYWTVVRANVLLKLHKTIDEIPIFDLDSREKTI